MPRSPLGRTLVIANPAAHSGAGERGAAFARRFLDAYASATRGYELRLTRGPGDAVALAARACGFDTVLALGGDGLVHEVACGLLSLPAQTRPALGVVPMGSGNDYARTLGMARNDVEAALAQLVRGRVAPLDVGRVNGTHFVQTLSFGLDAAIALDTTERRAHDTSQEGEALFVTSGLKVLARAGRGIPCTIAIDGGEPLAFEELVCAIQVGPTYGGGFRICPAADPADGLLDFCHNVRRPSLPHLLALFGLARAGRHAGSRVVRMGRLRHATIEFEREPPSQVDGEPLGGTRFEVSVEPGALRVVLPPVEGGRP